MLDTKLKNSNKAKRTGILLAALAAFIMVMLFPRFDENAAEYYVDEWREGVEGEDFAEILLQSNFVFYKDAMDRCSDKTYTYKELYMEEKLESAEGIDGGRIFGLGTVTGNDLYNDTEYTQGQSVDAGQLNSILDIYVSQMQDAADDIRSNYVDEIQTLMDYCVLEKNTGTVFKNTALPIEALLQEGQENGADYVYYIIMDYDEAGNLGNVKAKSIDADRLLKSVQKAASGNGGRILQNRDESETFFLFDEENEEVKQILTISQKNPSNVTFIYAMTEEQASQLSRWRVSWLDGFHFPSRDYIYYMAGVDGVYLMLMAGIFGVTILLALWKPERLEGKAPRKAPFEIVAVIAVILYGFGMELAVKIVASAGNDTIFQWMNLNTTAYVVLTRGLSFILFAALFGAGYWCFLELSDVTGGLKEYLATRSLIYRYWTEILGFFKGLYDRFKNEVLSVDLGKDNNKTLRKMIVLNFIFLSVVCWFWGFGIFVLIVYSLILYGLLKNYLFKIQAQYGKLLDATNSIAKGNLNNEFKENFGIFESYKEELYKIQGGFKNAVDEEVKSQKMKTELITNVSHDLKTPLTAIITYIDLLKEENLTEEQRREYLDTLERKSLRLKVLIEDLFEVSKATSGTVKLEPVPVDICNLIRQVYLEHEEKMKEAGLDVRFRMPAEKVILQLDPQKTYRIFENLYTNIIKYALAGTRVFVTAESIMQESVLSGNGEGRSGIHIELKNISASEIDADPQELTERFVRGDASRNTEGSGLGLAIAKNFVELQGGRFWIETDGDLFKAVIEWR